MSSPKKTIQEQIGSIYPTDTEALASFASRYGDDPAYESALIDCVDAEDEAISIASTWLIKHAADGGHRFGAEATSALCVRLDGVSAWESALHLAQSVGAFELSPEFAARLVRWLVPMIGHERPFLRAWSLDGLCKVAARHGRYRARAIEAVDDAGDDSAASVRARVRRLRRAFDYLESP